MMKWLYKYKLTKGIIFSCLVESLVRFVGTNLNWDQSRCFCVFLQPCFLLKYRGHLPSLKIIWLYFFQECNVTSTKFNLSGDLWTSTDVPYIVIEPGMEGQDSTLLFPSFSLSQLDFFFLFSHLVENGCPSPGSLTSQWQSLVVGNCRLDVPFQIAKGKEIRLP